MKKHATFFGLLVYLLTIHSLCFSQQKEPGSSYPAPKLSLSVGAGAAATYTYGGVWLKQTTPVLFVEPQYQFTQKWGVSLRAENVFASTYRATYRYNGASYHAIKASSMPSVALLINYRLTKNEAKWVPFVGVGVGTFFRGNGKLVTETTSRSMALGSCSGVVGRLGVASRHLTLAAEANVLNENSEHGNSRTWWGSSHEYRGRSYLALKLAYTINVKE